MSPLSLTHIVLPEGPQPDFHVSEGDVEVKDPPPPPDPSADAGLNIGFSAREGLISPPVHTVDIFTLSAVTALKLLGAGIEALVRITGDVPPTPAPDYSTTPNMRGMQAEKDNIVRSHSNTNLNIWQDVARPITSSKNTAEQPDGVILKRTPLGSPEIQPTQPYIVVDDNAEPLNLQHSAITRKFYSKQPPQISIEDYLLRIHKFCPMSSGVYLATSVYIHRLVVEERAIPVTRRNSHRLLLAGLRIAMKALEDLSYPHRRFSKVGGVSESELARLEIGFCFLTNFDLRTTKEQLLKHALDLKEISAAQVTGVVNQAGLKIPDKTKSLVNIIIQETGNELVADA